MGAVTIPDLGVAVGETGTLLGLDDVFLTARNSSPPSTPVVDSGDASLSIFADSSVELESLV